jgi:hypothetical protein
MPFRSQVFIRKDGHSGKESFEEEFSKKITFFGFAETMVSVQELVPNDAGGSNAGLKASYFICYSRIRLELYQLGQDVRIEKISFVHNEGSLPEL